ncbi:protein of unknown function [Pseudomonas sp. JV551A1]|nr:protein of unknown function [Pseudomonas sp. JV551A1]
MDGGDVADLQPGAFGRTARRRFWRARGLPAAEGAGQGTDACADAFAGRRLAAVSHRGGLVPVAGLRSCTACAGPFAGKPAPTGISTALNVYAVPVGAGLPAKRPAKATTYLDIYP